MLQIIFMQIVMENVISSACFVIVCRVTETKSVFSVKILIIGSILHFNLMSTNRDVTDIVWLEANMIAMLMGN